jgi:hypothetical protein
MRLLVSRSLMDPHDCEAKTIASSSPYRNSEYGLLLENGG